MPISTHDLTLLPGIDGMRRLCQSLAMLDAIICPECENRYYSFNAKWGEGEMLGSMRNSEGDEVMILFNRIGVCINGFDHNSILSPWKQTPPRIWSGLFENMPESFQIFFRTEPVPSIGTTFCVWRQHGDSEWRTGKHAFPNDPAADGSLGLLAIYDGDPDSYKAWIDANYVTNYPLDLIKDIYAHKPLARIDIQSLNPDVVREDLFGDIIEIGYPSGEEETD